MEPHRRQRGTSRALAFAALIAVLGAIRPAGAQNRNPSGLPTPRLYQVFPAGAKAGTTVEVIVAGRDLNDPEKLVFSDPAIKAEYVPPPAPEIDPKTKQPRPAKGALPADLFKFKVSVPAETPPGQFDVRLVGKWGVSNPRTFVVGDLAEALEKEPNNDVAQAQRIEINTTVNGTIAGPTDVDYFVFKAARGQRIGVHCLASSIDSRLQAALEVYDSKDRQLVTGRGYQGGDAVTDFTAPADGDYYVRLYQFTHNFGPPFPGGMPGGSSDHFYRLGISTAPWIDAVVPAVLEPGKTTAVTVYGRNLPGGKADPTALADDSVLEKLSVNVTAPADGKGKMTFSGHVGPPAAFLDGFELRLKNPIGHSNPFLLGLARAPVVIDSGDNDTPETAQEIALPCEIAGRIEKRRDRDWYIFQAKRGETWNIEVVSNRRGAPTFMMILVRNPATKSELYESPLQENMQVHPRRFYARSEDPPAYRFTAPADGKYQLLVASRAGDSVFGARHSYAVRISRDEPDFRLVALSAEVAVPDAPTVPAGGQTAFTVLVQRNEGFAGEIELSVEGLPPGVTCSPQVLAGNVRQTTLVLSAAADAAAWAGEINIKGTASVAGTDTMLTREARPAGISWPVQPNANIITVSRLLRANWISVRGKAPFTLEPTIDKPHVFPGDRATVKVKLTRHLPELKNPLQLTLMQDQQRQGSELPANLRFNNNQPINIPPAQAEASVNVTVGGDVPPGVYHVVFRGQTQLPAKKDAKGRQRQNAFVVGPSVPLRLEVAPKTLAALSLSTGAATVKIAGETELTVRVQRRYNYKGEFKVQLVLPPGVKGVEAAEVTIPAGKDEAKLVLRAAADATPGNRTNLLVRATALYKGQVPTPHEAKLNVNVVK